MKNKLLVALSFAYFMCFELAAAVEMKLPAEAQITGDFVRVRSKPGLDTAITGILYKNMIVKVSERSQEKTKVKDQADYWYKVKMDKIEGWTFGSFLDFTLKNKGIDTYYGNPNLDWFIKRYPIGTHEYSEKLKVDSFNFDEYRSLMEAAINGSNLKYPYTDSACYALLFSIYRHLKQKPNDEAYVYLKKKLYSKEYLFEMLTENHSCYQLLEYLPEKFIKNKDFFLGLFEGIRYYGNYYGKAFKMASDDLRNNKDYVGEIVKRNGMALEYAAAVLKDNDQIVLNAVTNQGSALQFASERLRDNKDIVLKAIEKIDYYEYPAIYYASKRLKDDKEVITKAVNKDADNLEYASDRLKDDRDIVLSAVSKYGYAIKYASKRLRDDPELAKTAYKNIPKSYDNEYGEVENFLEGISEHAKSGIFDDYDIMLEEVNREGTALEKASSRLKDNRELVLAAVSKNGNALEFASDRLKDDKEIVIDAVDDIGMTIKFASERLRDDEQVAKIALKNVTIRNYENVLNFLSERLREKYK